MKSAVFAISTIVFAVFSPIGVLANDNAPEAFLQALEGEFRGRGEARIAVSRSEERISCRLDNSFDSSRQALDVVGTCATTQGKADVNGKLVLQDGEVVGSFLSPFRDSEITQSDSKFSEDRLVISTSMVSKSTGNLSRMRQIISRDEGGGFRSVFQKFDNASDAYQDTGYVEFSPVGN